MPEYILPDDDNETFQALSSFAQGYVTAMFWTEEERLCEESEGERTTPDVAVNTATMESRFVGGNSYGPNDLSPEAWAQIKKDCDAFEKHAALYAEWDDEYAGHDFWLSRNGHGAGFFDRGRAAGDELHQIAKKFGHIDLELGDDGKLYLS